MQTHVQQALSSRSTIGSRAFPVNAAKMWNAALPDSVVSATSIDFRHQLKTFLFQRLSVVSTLVGLAVVLITLPS